MNDLPPLPKSDDAYWKGGNNKKLTLKKVTCDTHFFIQIASREAKCQNCPVGFILPIGASVSRGHIYLHGELMI